MKCMWIRTDDGQRCDLRARGSGLCHLHDPDGAIARQHPEYREVLQKYKYEVMAAKYRRIRRER